MAQARSELKTPVTIVKIPTIRLIFVSVESFPVDDTMVVRVSKAVA
jgi:hypothetical protein